MMIFLLLALVSIYGTVAVVLMLNALIAPEEKSWQDFAICLVWPILIGWKK